MVFCLLRYSCRKKKFLLRDFWVLFIFLLICFSLFRVIFLLIGRVLEVEFIDWFRFCFLGCWFGWGCLWMDVRVELWVWIWLGCVGDWKREFKMLWEKVLWLDKNDLLFLCCKVFLDWMWLFLWCYFIYIWIFD